jgi:hypothetical protein
LNKYLSNLSEHHDMYVPLLLGFRFGIWILMACPSQAENWTWITRSWGWEVGGWRARVLLCCSYWYLVFGGYTRPARSVSGKKARRAGTRHFALRGKGVCMLRRVVHLAITNPRILPTAALFQNSSRSNYRSQSSYISPLDSPLRVSHVSHERHPTSLART